jgi:hypothetical protein
MPSHHASTEYDCSTFCAHHSHLPVFDYSLIVSTSPGRLEREPLEWSDTSTHLPAPSSALLGAVVFGHDAFLNPRAASSRSIRACVFGPFGTDLAAVK